MKKCKHCNTIDDLYIGKNDTIWNICKKCKFKFHSIIGKKQLGKPSPKKGKKYKPVIITIKRCKYCNTTENLWINKHKTISNICKKCNSELHSKLFKTMIRTQEHGKNISISLKKIKRTEEDNNKTSIGLKRYYKTHFSTKKDKTFEEIYGVKRATEIIAKIHTPEMHSKAGKTLSNRISLGIVDRTPQKNAAKKYMLNKWKDENYKKQQLKKMSIYYIKNQTSIEKKIQSLLQQLNIEYESQKCIYNFIVDFYLPKYNIIIECDGDYWHNLQHIVKRDIIKNKIFNDNDYKMIRIQEKQIKRLTKEFFEFILDDVIMNDVAYSKW